MVSALEQHIRIRRGTGVSIPEQIVRQVRALVESGLLLAGDAMPSSRALAQQLGVSRGSVTTAYDQLTVEGVVVASARSGVHIHPDVTPRLGQDASHQERSAPTNVLTESPKLSARQHDSATRGNGSERHEGSTRLEASVAESPSHRRAGLATALSIDFTPGREPAVTLSDALWRRAWREALHPEPDEVRIPAQGSPRLRRALAEHLRLVRAINVNADDIVITAGARDGLALTLSVMRHRLGRECVVAIESPGFPGLRNSLRRLGAQLLALPADASGPLPSDDPPDVVLLTPNHQFPYGSALPSARRRLLIDWAREVGAYVIEDDYDSEYRHLGPPHPALLSTADDVVIHVGTFTRVLGPDVGTGYVVTPRSLQQDFATLRAATGATIPAIAQRAVAGYLENGGVRRHIARSRRRLIRTQHAVTSVVGAAQLDHPVRNTGHLLIVETSESRAQRWRDACRDKSIGVGLLADGWAGPTGMHGIMMSYGAHEAEAAARGLDVVLALTSAVE